MSETTKSPLAQRDLTIAMVADNTSMASSVFEPLTRRDAGRQD
jgi:hypothetical protein